MNYIKMMILFQAPSVDADGTALTYAVSIDVAEVKSYTVTWVDQDGTVLETDAQPTAKGPVTKIDKNANGCLET